MGGLMIKMSLIKSNQSVDLLIDIKVLDKAFSQEVIEVLEAHTQIFDVLLSNFRFPILDNYQWSHQSSSVRGDVDGSLLDININAYKFLNSSFFTE